MGFVPLRRDFMGKIAWEAGILPMNGETAAVCLRKVFPEGEYLAENGPFLNCEANIPMEVTLQMLLIVCPLVFLASFVDAIAGGGGLISLPAYLVAGLPPVTAAANNKFSSTFGTMLATYRFFRGGKVFWRPALCAVAGALPGALIGAELLKHTPEKLVYIFMLVAVPVVAVVMLLRRDKEPEPKPVTTATLAKCVGVGLACGLYDGFFGPGTGTFLILLLTWLIGMDMVTASGTAKPVNLASNVAALVSFISSGYVIYQLAVPAMLCSLVGGYLGSSMALKKGAKLIRGMMFVVMALLIVKLITGMMDM